MMRELTGTIQCQDCGPCPYKIVKEDDRSVTLSIDHADGCPAADGGPLEDAFGGVLREGSDYLLRHGLAATLAAVDAASPPDSPAP
jgi:hypothetical protein